MVGYPHNPKVTGSNPVPATKSPETVTVSGLFIFEISFAVNLT